MGLALDQQLSIDQFIARIIERIGQQREIIDGEAERACHRALLLCQG
jgi:hypothetical protein